MKGGAEVDSTSSRVEDHGVADPLSAAAESVLAVVRPFGNFWSYFVVDGGGDRFVVDVFEPKGAGVVARAVGGVDGVGVVGAFWEIDAEVDVEGIFGEVAIAEVILGSVEGLDACWASVVPAPVSHAVYPWGAVLGV